MTVKTKSKKKAEILYVEILEAKPNKMFTEEQRQSVRFLRYNRPIECAECGKKRKLMWTMLCEFDAISMNKLVPQISGKIHPPLTPVCSEHPLGVHFPDENNEGLSAVAD